MVLSRQMDRRLSPPASRVQMSAATLGVYRVGRPRPRRAFGFGLAFRLSVRVALDIALMAGDDTRYSRFAASLLNGCRGPALVPLMAMLADAAGVWRPERSSLHGPVWAEIAGSSG